MNSAIPSPAQFFLQLETLLNTQGLQQLSGFARDLFARASWEDIAPYTPEAMLIIVKNAWNHLQTARDGKPSIRIYEPEWGSSPISILEIINDNRPFIFDSVMGELSEQGLNIRLVAHPVLTLERTEEGAFNKYLGLEPIADKKRESFIHIHLNMFTEETEKKALIDALELVLHDVRFAVEDWKPMMARVDGAIAHIEASPPPIPYEDMSEGLEFLKWLRDNNFTFLGIREHKYTGGEKNGRLEPMDETGLGLLRDPAIGILRRGTKPVTMTPEIHAFLNAPTLLIVSKSNLRSRVHRRTYMDYIGIKLFNTEGQLRGELRLTGLFTSTAYTRSVSTIPYLRRKVDYVLKRAGFDADSHSGKALLTVLENFPRDELFQLEGDTLFEFVMAALELEERPRIRVMARRDKFERFVSTLIFIPRESVTTELRIRIGDLMAKSFGGRISGFTPSYPEGPLARLHYIIGKETDVLVHPDRTELETGVANIVQTWSERLIQAIEYEAGTDIRLARNLQATWETAFDAAYCQDYTVETAKFDIKTLEKLRGERAIALDFFHRDSQEAGEIHLKIFHKSSPIALSERVPMLENMGFRVIAERTYTLHPIYDGRTPAIAFLHDMTLTLANAGDLKEQGLFARLDKLFMAVWDGQAENDQFNTLSLLAGLSWREVALLRAIARYLRQVQTTYPLDYMAQTLVKHPQIARHIVNLFMAKFNPMNSLDVVLRGKSLDTIRATIDRALTQVEALDEDRILRRFINIVDAAVRTNYFQNIEGETISFKLISAQVDNLPKPKPMAEIWVYSPRVEGVHLRFGRIARGGLRWSDRPQDFRTEVLGLVKAQQVKNAVIVPVGAKGGFVPKQMPVGGSRDAMFAEGTESYKLFVSSLLDITDNRSPKGEILPPVNVVRHDGDDPYLVVAADKGTATFSDTANGISQVHNFWLGDAFASGGSVGYDHKKMGITARGAWEAVKRHFREVNVDIQTTPFTVAGVGDMSGDVFGNGMLLSRAIKLVAAFDHRDIFLDPSPDTEKSFRERERMFALPRSSWADYDTKLISKGGGIFSRSLKSIPISTEIKAVLGIESNELTPAELMTSILKAPVDLMWFGGIGTYIRATDETDAQVGDRANDSIRITAPELRAKVIGEGANLGTTQRSRIEMARHGVRLNTDAIDNSAGVNSSDMEVNIKIALEGIVREGRLTMPARNELLASMTDEVGHLVLMNNYRQTLAVSVAQYGGVEDLAFAERLMLYLEAEGRLDRAVEFLPSSVEVAQRAENGHGLTHPEIAVLLAYAKLSLKASLLTSERLNDAALKPLLLAYFPTALQKAYKNDLLEHGLKREIIATKLVNLVIDQGGPTILPRLLEQTGTTPIKLAIAFALAWHVFDGDSVLKSIDALDQNADGQTQLKLYAELQKFMHTQSLWFIRNETLDQPINTIRGTYTDGMDKIRAALGGTPTLAELSSALELTRIHQRTGTALDTTIITWNAVDVAFQLSQLRAKAQEMPLENYYDTLASARLLNDVTRAQHNMTKAALTAGNFAAWKSKHAEAIQRVSATIAMELQNDKMTLARLAVLNGFITDLSGI